MDSGEGSRQYSLAGNEMVDDYNNETFLIISVEDAMQAHTQTSLYYIWALD